ncbi:MAG: hypothetical protein M3P08_07655 [Thermoproteota archaeon]|nr:hypothetical protein [Thermoproteota archaeon]
MMSSIKTDSKWTTSCLVERFKLELATVKEADKELDNRKYYNQAHNLLKIGALKPTPFFIIYLSDLSPQLIKELHSLDSKDRDFVLKQAVGRIFEDINATLYHNSISRVLRVKLQ